jgi:UTP--glucose-1-phosphate uridylyltransferase
VTPRKAVIPAAGLGTRFLPATKAVPKELLPIVDIPTIQYVVQEIVDSGMTDVVLVTGRGKSAIEDHFDVSYELERNLEEKGKHELLRMVRDVSKMVHVVSVRQKQPLGLGHAVLCARQAIGDEPFGLLLGDDLIDSDDDPGIGQLARVYQETGSGAIAIMEVPPGKEHMYGIVAGERDAAGRLRIRDMVEKPRPGTAPTRLAIIGRYVLPPEVWPMLEATRPGHGGEIQLTDALQQLARSPQGLLGVEIKGTRHDAGDRLGYLRANLAYALKRADLRDPLLDLMRELLRENPG